MKWMCHFLRDTEIAGVVLHMNVFVLNCSKVSKENTSMVQSKQFIFHSTCLLPTTLIVLSVYQEADFFYCSWMWHIFNFFCREEPILCDKPEINFSDKENSIHHLCVTVRTYSIMLRTMSCLTTSDSHFCVEMKLNKFKLVHINNQQTTVIIMWPQIHF